MTHQTTRQDVATTEVEGFILSRQWQENPNGQELIFWLSTPAGPVQVTVHDQEAVFFIGRSDLTRTRRVLSGQPGWRNAEVALLTFAAAECEPVEAFYFANQKLLNIARAKLDQADIRLFEADVRPSDRYLMERFIKGSVSILGEVTAKDGLGRCVNPKMQPSAYLPSLNILSIDIETSYTENIIYSIAIYGKDVSKVFMVSGETQAPLPMMEYVRDEAQLIECFLSFMAICDPDVIIGWSVVAFDLWFIQTRCEALGIEFTLGRANEAVRWRTATRGRERHYALVPGRVVLDGIELLRTATYTFESYALDFVARQLLGRGKLVDDVDARATEIQEMYASDKQSLAQYNLEDCVLVYEIFEKTQLIEFAIQRACLTGLDIDRAGGSVAAFDFLYLPRLHRQGYIAPVVFDEPGGASPGGYVLDSKPGLYSDVIVLDFKSLYPSIIRTFHVDPLAMICAGSEEDVIPGFRDASFSRTRYILPSIIEELWVARDVAKQSGQAANSQAIKIIMNSFYGVLGTPGCRFFDPKLVSSITLRGHEILKKTRDLIESAGYQVIYGDTDSVFVLLQGAAEPANLIGERLMTYLNTWWRDHLKQTYELESFLEVEYETHFQRFLMPTIRGSDKGSKKRYAGVISDGGEQHIVFKGLETVRSDWTQLAREFQRELYRLMFADEPFEDYVLGMVEAVHSGLCDDKLVFRRRLRRKLEEYQKNVPPHVRAATKLAEIRKAKGLPPATEFGGGWVEYIMTINGPEPRLYRTSRVDYQFYVDKQLAPVADAILLFKSTSLAQITDKQLGLF